MQHCLLAPAANNTSDSVKQPVKSSNFKVRVFYSKVGETQKTKYVYMEVTDRRDDSHIDELVTKRFMPSLLWDAEVQQYLEAALGRDAFSRVSEAICTPPLVTCVRVNTLRTSRETVAEELREKLVAARPAGSISVELHPLVPDAVLVHGAGPREVDYSSAAGKEIVVSRKAGEAVLRGAHVFVPGVLACSRGVEKGDLVAVSVALDSPKGRLTVHRGSVTEHLKHVPGRPDLYIGACCY